MNIFTHLKQRFDKSKDRQAFENKHHKLRYVAPLNQLWSPEMAEQIDDTQLMNRKFISKSMSALHQDLYHTLNHSSEVDELIERYVENTERYRKWKSMKHNRIWIDKEKKGSQLYKRDAYIFAKLKRNTHGDIPLFACPTSEELKNVQDIKNMLTKYEDTFTLKDIVDDGDEYEFRFEINSNFVTQGNPYRIYKSITLNEQKEKTSVILGESNTDYPIIWDLNKTHTILISGNRQSEYQKMIKDMMVSLIMLNQSQQDMNITLISDSEQYRDIQKNHACIRRLTSSSNLHDDFMKDLESDIKRRIAMMNQTNDFDIEELNRELRYRNEKPLSKHVIIIDNVSHISEDFTLNEKMDESYYSKLGIYFIIATDSDYKTSPYFLAQAPSRIAMQVDNKMQSERIINQYGAENLRSNGEFYATSSIYGVDTGWGQILNTDSEFVKSYEGGNESVINKIDKYVKKQQKSEYMTTKNVDTQPQDAYKQSREDE